MADITIRIPAELVQPLVGLLDAGLRATGLPAAAAAAQLGALIELAARAANASAAAAETPTASGAAAPKTKGG